MYSIRMESVPCKLLFCSWLQWFVETGELGLSKEIQSCNQIKSYQQRRERMSAAPSLFTLILLHYSPHAFLGGNLFLSPANFPGLFSVSSSIDDKRAASMTVRRLAHVYAAKKVEVDI